MSQLRSQRHTTRGKQHRIKCGSCKGTHSTVAAVRQCYEWAAQAVEDPSWEWLLRHGGG